MKKSTQILRVILTIVLTAFVFTSCVDKDYDDIVTANVDPDLQATHTIQQLQGLVVGTTPLLITTDVIIKGVVAGDDLSGNIYKKLILQEGLFGVGIQVDVSNFNTEYPTGRRVFVKCKGLYLENNGGNFELGTSPGSTMGRIPAGLLTKYLVKGMWGQYITPAVYTFDNSNIPTNTLVKFNDVQFNEDFTDVAYAAASPANLDLEDCNGIKLILYSSTYSTFALAKTPTGKGSIVGIYTLYSNEGELQIRDTTDVVMNDLRCDGTIGTVVTMPIDSVRLLDPGGAVDTLPNNTKIVGTVTSDYSTSMLTGNGRNMYLEDNTAGIQIFFTQAHSFAVGTKVEIKISKKTLSNYNGVLEITGVTLQSVTTIGTGSVIPRTVTIPDINANYALWEGSLVKIDNVTISGNATYAGVNFLNDAASNSIELYTTFGASFAGDSVKTGVVSVTGILTEFNGTKEILMRNTNDVQ